MIERKRKGDVGKGCKAPELQHERDVMAISTFAAMAIAMRLYVSTSQTALIGRPDWPAVERVRT